MCLVHPHFRPPWLNVGLGVMVQVDLWFKVHGHEHPPMSHTTDVPNPHRLAVPTAVSALRALHEQFIDEQRFLVRLSSETLRGYRQTFAVLSSLMPTITA